MIEQNDEAPANADATPVLPYVTSKAVPLGKTSYRISPLQIALAIAAVPTAYCALAGGRPLIPLLPVIGLALIAIWWGTFVVPRDAYASRMFLQMRIAAIVVSVATAVFAARVGEATEGETGLGYWMQDNPGYRYARHYSMEVVPYIVGGLLWYAVAAAILAVRRRRSQRPLVSADHSQSS